MSRDAVVDQRQDYYSPGIVESMHTNRPVRDILKSDSDTGRP